MPRCCSLGAPAGGAAAAPRRHRACVSEARPRDAGPRGTRALVRRRAESPHLRGMRTPPRPRLQGWRRSAPRAARIASPSQLPDGTTIAGRVERGPFQPRFWGGPWMTTLMFALDQRHHAGPVGGLCARPRRCRRSRRAAENFSLDGAGEPLPERGPEEIRSVARALNRMRERIAAADVGPHQNAARRSATICARRSHGCACAPSSSRTRPTAGAC